MGAERNRVQAQNRWKEMEVREREKMTLNI